MDTNSFPITHKPVQPKKKKRAQFLHCFFGISFVKQHTNLNCDNYNHLYE